MLSKEENELLTRVGPATPMGTLLRQYWQPALLISELPEPESPPVRVRLLGEDLVAFRDSNGRIGLLREHCPHRGASLFFGRNEECGLRCVYHGWKFDVAGQCVDMPNEPPESNFKQKIRTTAYPCRELGGIIWAYLGPLADPPGLPEIESYLVPDSQRYMTKRYQHANWAQSLEGDLDSSHVSFLHSSLNQNEEFRHTALLPGMVYMARDKHPRFEVVDTEYGMLIGARRDADADTYYWRITQFIMPFYVIVPRDGDSAIHVNAWVPIDDENTMVWSTEYHPTRSLSDQELSELQAGAHAHGRPEDFLPATYEAGSAWRPRANRSNNYELDYEAQRTSRFSGIVGFWRQDLAIVESMGPILDRTPEHLGASDAAVIRVRRYLLRAANALQQDGLAAPGLDPATHHVRSTAVILPRDVMWVEGARQELIAPPSLQYESV